MFKDKEAAKRMNDAVRKISDAMAEAVKLTNDNSFSKKDRSRALIVNVFAHEDAL